MEHRSIANSLFGVVTTIQQPTPAILDLAKRLRKAGAALIVAGDRKGPSGFEVEGVEFLPLERQLELDFELARKLPTGHYARKNLGYLAAMERGASCIYETDDDNAPAQSWTPRAETVRVLTSSAGGWLNVYRLYSDDLIWPRGFPLDAVGEAKSRPAISAEPADVRAPIQQGLVNNSPDVDAIWRLVLDRPFNFESGPSVRLDPGTWCPFNSQSTWWWPSVYSLMYLPSYCSFRMTDIWRSFVAQRCLWEANLGVVFHQPEVIQERNAHNLMRDFSDEVPGYTRNTDLVAVLERTDLKASQDSAPENLLRCYESLVGAGFLPPGELTLVSAWVEDVGRACARLSDYSNNVMSRTRGAGEDDGPFIRFHNSSQLIKRDSLGKR